MIAALTLVILSNLVPHTQPSHASIADLPYRLVPAMTSSLGVDMDSLAVSDSLIVWEDRRNGISEVFAYDVDDAHEFRPSRSPASKRSPDVHQSTVIWIQGSDPRQSVIEGINLSDGQALRVTEEPAFVAHPVISEGVIAWQERGDDRWVVKAYLRESGETVTLSDASANAGRPSVSDSRVVWQQFDGESWNIRAFDAESGNTISITSSDANEKYPDIFGERVVYVRSAEDGGNPELVTADVDGRNSRTLLSEHYLMKPSIHGNLVVWEDWRSGFPDIYGYDLEHDETFAIARSQQAAAPVVSDRLVAWISGESSGEQRVQALEIQERLPTDPRDPPAVPEPDRLYVEETKHFVSSGFKSFWQANGGPAVLGYPITEEFRETDPRSGGEVIVQYFERVKLEYHPDAPEGQQIQLALLGAEMLPQQEAKPVEPFEDTDERRYFETTGHSIRGSFKGFWENYGGLALFGFPLTEEFTEHGRTVQYFERARFEFDPEAEPGQQVQLGLLGREALQERGWIPPPPIDTTQIFE